MKITESITIVTGEIEAGKTRFCQQAANHLKKQGLDLAGILSPAVFEGENKIAIDALDLRTSERKRLAEQVAKTTPLQGPHTKRWQFSDQTVQWGNQVLHKAIPCDLLCVDELGPLEFEHNLGFTAAFEAINTRQYQTCLVVVRPYFIDTALTRWPYAQVLNIQPKDNPTTLLKTWLGSF